MSNKELDLKERLRQALTSTVKVISDDLELKKNNRDNKILNKFNTFELDNLNNKADFIKARARADSSALKKNFQVMRFIKKIFQLILVVNLYMQFQKRLDMKLLEEIC